MAVWSEREPMAELWIDARRGGSAAFAHLSRVQKFYLWLRKQAKAAPRQAVAARLMRGDDAMRITDVAIVGGGLAGLARRRHARPRRHRRRAGRSAPGLSAGFPLREARRAAGRDPAQDRARRRGAARGDARPRMLGRSLRPADRQAAGRSVRHFLRAAGQHRARRNSAARADDRRQGDGDRDRPANGKRSRCRTAKTISARLVVLANGLNIGAAQVARYRRARS